MNKNFINKLQKTIFFLFILTLQSCSSVKEVPKQQEIYESPENVFWENLTTDEKIGFFSYSNSGIKYHCVKIDLTNENLKIVAYKNKADLLNRISPKTFIKNTNAKIVINTTPYMKSGKLCGVYIENGVKYSSEIEKYSALYFEESENGLVAKISENQKEEDFENALFAYGGFFTILKDGEIQSFKHTSFDARSAAGISEDGKTLYLLTVENPFFGRGLSYPECAEILSELGATNALEFDGGSSTSLFVDGKINFKETMRKNSAYLGFFFK